jgi:hypothetical protein
MYTRLIAFLSAFIFSSLKTPSATLSRVSWLSGLPRRAVRKAESYLVRRPSCSERTDFEEGLKKGQCSSAKAKRLDKVERRVSCNEGLGSLAIVYFRPVKLIKTFFLDMPVIFSNSSALSPISFKIFLPFEGSMKDLNYASSWSGVISKILSISWDSV